MEATPILDRQQPLHLKQSRHWWAALIGGAAGVGLVLPKPSFDLNPLLDRPLEIGLTVFGVFFLAILWHEAGHLIGGFSAGFAFRQFAIGPVVINRESRGLRLQFAGARLLAGGQVAMVPEDTAELRSRFLRFLGAGPTMTVLLFTIPVLLPGSFFTHCLLAVNSLIAIGSLVPYTVNGRSTDAKLIVGLLRPGPAAERLAAILYLLAIDSSGASPRNWPADTLRALEREGGDSAYREIGLMFVYFCAMEDGDPERIASALERVLALAHRLNPDTRRAYLAEAAFVQGIFRRNELLARAWLDDARQVKGTLPRKDWDCAALAGIARAGGDIAQACEQLRRSIAMLDRQPGNSGSVAACRGRLAAILAELS
jgi:hypothetical protein